MVVLVGFGGSKGFGVGLRGLCVWGAGLTPFLPPQDSSGLRLWKRRWFVLVDLCLYYYRGEARGRGWVCGRGQGLLRAPWGKVWGNPGGQWSPCHETWGSVGFGEDPGAAPLNPPLLPDSSEQRVRGGLPLPGYRIRVLAPSTSSPRFLFTVSPGGNSKQGTTTAATLQQRLGPQSPAPHVGLGVLWLNEGRGWGGGCPGLLLPHSSPRLSTLGCGATCWGLTALRSWGPGCAVCGTLPHPWGGEPQTGRQRGDGAYGGVMGNIGATWGE